MAREFAKLRLSMSNDDDFRALAPHEQHLYVVLMRSMSLSYCGIGDWRPSRIAPLAAGWTVEQVVYSAAGLVDKLYLLVDESTEEVLVRSFIRHDEILKQPKMSIAMAKAYAVAASPTLRGVVVHELNRLHEEDPALKGWTVEAVTDLLSKPSVNPSSYPLGKGSDWPSVKGSVNPSGWGNPNPPTNPPVNPPLTTNNLQLATSNQQQGNDSLRSSGASAPKRSKPRRRLPDDWAPTDAHRKYAAEHGIDIDHEVGQFRAHAESKDRQQADWDAAFRTWLGNEVKWDRPRQTQAVPTADGFQLPTAPKEIIDNPDPTVYVRWARAQRDEWLAAQNGSVA